MTRTAQCQCGALRVEITVEPVVVACSCIACQRRTGSVIGVGAYVPKDQATIHGPSREFVRMGDSGNAFRTHFCPDCGSSVYWVSDRDPERIGIAVGAFGDPAFPAPHRSVFDESKHSWIVFGPETPGFVRGRDSAASR